MKATTRKVSFTHKLGDAIERIGEVVSKTGATRLGSAIYNFGNKVEHKDDQMLGRNLRKGVR